MRLKLIYLSCFLCSILNAQTGQEYLSKIGIVDSISSNVLGETREIYIQLPSSFDAQKTHKYPVVYILDGEVLLPVVHTTHEFYYGGFMPEMILVGISNSENRTRDLTTSKVEKMYGMPFHQENGKAHNFIQFLEEELIPFVENKYPASSFRTLIGHSYGGLFTVYSLMNRPHLFSNYLAIDPSLDWDDQDLLKKAEDVLKANNFQNKSLFISLNGQLNNQNPEVTIDNVMQDTSETSLFARSNIAFSNAIRLNKQNGLAFEWKFYPRDLHGTIPMPSIMDGLISLFEWFQMENTHKINNPATNQEELSKIIRYRAQKLQDHFGYKVPPYPEDLLNILGYMSMDMDQPKKALMFFEFGLEYYPDSPNVYDALADYYIKQEDLSKALEFVHKAYNLSQGDYQKKRIKELQEKIKNSN